MIYLNNAATSFPKPQSVQSALTAALVKPPEGQYRSSYQEGIDILTCCRQNLAKLFGTVNWERIFFSSGATDSLNTIIQGINLEGKQIITTVTEHNSVLRPLLNSERIQNDPAYYKSNIIIRNNKNHKEKEKNILHDDLQPVEHDLSLYKVIIVCCDENGYVNPSFIHKYINGKTGAVIINHCSNVTGRIQDIKRIKDGLNGCIPLIVDASQSAGCIPINIDDMGIDILAFTGHKSLFGPTGIGGYYVSPNIKLKPFRYGGTGTNSSVLMYTKEDYEYEAGTQNTVGIEGLNAGVEYLLKKGIESIRHKEKLLMQRLYEGLKSNKQIHLFGYNDKIDSISCGKTGGKDKFDCYGPVLSFTISGLQPGDAGYIFQNVYDVVLRVGLHCTPLIHDAIGSGSDGTIRVSISDMTTENEVDEFIKIVNIFVESLKENKKWE